MAKESAEQARLTVADVVAEAKERAGEEVTPLTVVGSATTMTTDDLPLMLGRPRAGRFYPTPRGGCACTSPGFVSTRFGPS